MHDGGGVEAVGVTDGVALAADGLVRVAHHLVEAAEGVPRVEGAHTGLGQVAGAVAVAELDRAAEALDGRAVLATARVDLPLQVEEVGEVRVGLECVAQHVESLVPALERVQGGDDVPQQQRGVVGVERGELAERAPEVAEGGLVVADALVLDAGVEEGEGVGGLALHLLHHDRHVAIGLLLAAAGRLEVAVVMDLDAHEAGADTADGVDLAHDLLVQRAGVAVGRLVAEEPEGGVDDALDAELLTDEVDLAQAVALDVLVVQQLLQRRAVDQLLVGVEHQDPVARRGVDARVARGGEVALPLLVEHGRAERLGDLDGAVDRAGVDDDDLVDDPLHARKAARQVLLLVAHDHAERDPLGGPLLRRGERRDREAHLGPSGGLRSPPIGGSAENLSADATGTPRGAGAPATSASAPGCQASGILSSSGSNAR